MGPIEDEIFSLAMLFYWSVSDTPVLSGKFLGEKFRQDQDTYINLHHRISIKGDSRISNKWRIVRGSITLQPKDQTTSNNQVCLSHQTNVHMVLKLEAQYILLLGGSFCAQGKMWEDTHQKVMIA